MNILSALFGAKSAHDDCDELCRLLEETNVTTREAWDIVNTKRQERGEKPVDPPPPSFEELLGLEKPYPRDSG